MFGMGGCVASCLREEISRFTRNALAQLIDWGNYHILRTTR